MSFIPQFNVSDLMQGVTKEIDRLERLIETSLDRVGLQFVIEARDRAAKGFNFFGSDYQDRTGNLRSSIGYVILKNGMNISENFETAGEGENPDKGVQNAKDFAYKILGSAEYNTGYVLICVAGMEYAAAVEAKGFDVITSSAFKAENTLIKEWESLKKLTA